MPHSSLGTSGDLAGMSEKILYLPAGRQGGNLSLSLTHKGDFYIARIVL
jgi:hypothetical protein